MRGCTLILAAALVVTGLAGADTLYLKNGVQVEGKVITTPEGLLKLQVGNRSVFYRPDEVERIEENDRTGVLDREAAIAQWRVRDEELTHETGLNAEQRDRVKTLMYQLQREDERPAAQRELVALQKEMDVFRYLEYRFPGLSDRLSPWGLETMAYIDAKRALPTLRDALEKNIYLTRAKAMEILGKIGDRESAVAIARGLVDHAPEVQYTAAYALAELKARQATPALIELFDEADRRVRNAAQEALQAMWADKTGNETYNTREQWEALWQTQSATVGDAILLASLRPLVLPEEEFQQE
jgi:hypothetical protein